MLLTHETMYVINNQYSRPPCLRLTPMRLRGNDFGFFYNFYTGVPVDSPTSQVLNNVSELFV